MYTRNAKSSWLRLLIGSTMIVAAVIAGLV